MKSLAPPTPVTAGGTDHGTSALRWGTSWVQQVDATISSNAVASISMTNSNAGSTADARVLANSATQVIGLVMRSDAHTTNLVSGAGDAILYTSSTRLRLQWNGNMRAHGVGTDWVVGVGEGASTASAGGVRAPDIVGTDQAGATLTVRPGLSTGAGAGGSLLLQSGTTGTTGTVQNAAITRVTLSPTGTAFAGAVASDTSIWNLGSNQFYKDTSGNIGLGVVPSGTYHLQAQKASTAVYAASSAAAAVPAGYLASSYLNSATATDGTSALHVMSATNSVANQSIIYYGLVNGSTAAFAGNFVIGRRTGSTAYTESFRITTAGDVVIGNGDLVAAPSAAVLRGSDASGTDIASASLTIRTGRGTGAGAAGSLIFQTAAVGTTGAALQTATTRMTISGAGVVTPGASGTQDFGSTALTWGAGYFASGAFNLATTQTCPVDVKTKFLGGLLNNGAIRVERFNTTNAGHIENISGLGLYDGSRYSISGNRNPDATASSGVLFANGVTTFYNNAGLTAGTAYTPTATLNINTAGVVSPAVSGSGLGSAGLRWNAFVTGVDATGNVLTSGATSGVGYTTGAGGTVTQLTSKATGVTLSKPTGQITTAADALAAGALVSFTLTNTLLAATDNITVQRQSGGTAGAYRVWVDSVAVGSCVVCIENRSAGSLSEQLVLNMNLHKGANA